MPAFDTVSELNWFEIRHAAGHSDKEVTNHFDAERPYPDPGAFVCAICRAKGYGTGIHELCVGRAENLGETVVSSQWLLCRLSVRALMKKLRLALARLLATAIVLVTVNIGHAAPLSNAVQVATGRDHSCAVTDSGAVYCWGANDFGQLGDGTIIRSSHPRAVQGVSNAIEATAGDGFSCARLGDGTVRCWGKSHFVGVDVDTRSTPKPMPPTQPTGLNNVVSLGSGFQHSCALKSDGQVQCWGGTGDDSWLGRQAMFGFWYLFDPQVPIPIQSSESFQRLVVGPTTTCAFNAQNQAHCWGYLSALYPATPQRNPARAPMLDSAQRLAIGEGHACVSFATGGVKCWGSGTSGQLGQGTFESSAALLSVTGLGEVSDVTVGTSHSCALLPGGDVKCWGNGEDGVLGYGHLSNTSAPGTPISASEQFVSISGGRTQVCAITSGKTVKCWGLKIGLHVQSVTDYAQTIPVEIEEVQGATQVTASSELACAVLQDTSVTCWGHYVGSTGFIGTRSKLIPGLTSIVQVSTGIYRTCALRADGRVFCWAGNEYLAGSSVPLNAGAPPTPVSNLEDATHISVGDYTTCVVRATGKVSCWGSNWSLILGPSASYPDAPVEIPQVTDAVQVATTPENACALRRNGTVRCWGFWRTGTRDIAALQDVAEIAPSFNGVCARLRNGAVKCFTFDGETEQFKPAVTYSSIASQAVDFSFPAGSTTATPQMFAGTLCIIEASGSVSCMGRGEEGALGNGGLRFSAIRSPVVGIVNATQISGGSFGTACARLATGRVACWGRGMGGVAGPDASVRAEVPTLVEFPPATQVTLAAPSGPSETRIPYEVSASVASNLGIGYFRVLDDTGGSCETNPIATPGSASCNIVSKIRGNRKLNAVFYPANVALGYIIGTQTRAVQTSCDLDIDGDGKVLAGTDGVMLLRKLNNLPAATVPVGVSNPMGLRNTWQAIDTHLNLLFSNGALDASTSGDQRAWWGYNDPLFLIRALSGWTKPPAFSEERRIYDHFVDVCRLSQ